MRPHIAQLLASWESAITSSLAETTLGTATAAPNAMEPMYNNNLLKIIVLLPSVISGSGVLRQAAQVNKSRRIRNPRMIPRVPPFLADKDGVDGKADDCVKYVHTLRPLKTFGGLHVEI